MQRYGFYYVPAAVALAVLIGLNVQGRAASLDLGFADPVAVDQPRVAVEVYTPDPEHSYGPDIANLFLLDTGAQGLLAAGYAVEELTEAGYQTEGVFYELGLGGLSPYDVSAVYNFDFAGSDGTRQTIADVRIMSDAEANFGGFGGIVGTPGLVNRVTTLDMVNMLGDESDIWGLGFDYMGVAFSTAVPAGNGNRYTVPVELVDFAPPAQPGDDPLPTYGPLPFVTLRMRNGSFTSGGTFVLDTGAQVSMISTAVAIELGLDTNGNGTIEDEAIGMTEFSGASGTVEVPIVAIEKAILPTAEGVDLIWTSLELPVYDIDPSIAGIFGSDLLTTGWFRAVFETRDHGAFEQVHLDFTDPASGQGTLVLDINPAYEFLTALNPAGGDADIDGDVDLADFVTLKRNFGLDGASWSDGDFNADGLIDLEDFLILKSNFGSHVTP